MPAGCSAARRPCVCPRSSGGFARPTFERVFYSLWPATRSRPESEGRQEGITVRTSTFRGRRRRRQRAGENEAVRAEPGLSSVVGEEAREKRRPGKLDSAKLIVSAAVHAEPREICQSISRCRQARPPASRLARRGRCRLCAETTGSVGRRQGGGARTISRIDLGATRISPGMKEFQGDRRDQQGRTRDFQVADYGLAHLFRRLELTEDDSASSERKRPVQTAGRMTKVRPVVGFRDRVFKAKWIPASREGYALNID